MKYIRTADGRIMKHPHPNEEVFTFRYEIVKSADSIEELCDEFVYVDNKPCIYRHTFIADFQIKDYLKIDGIIYGAIWTDKGLIFVARMNNKGVLELL